MHRVRHLLYPALPVTVGARATALAVLAASLLGAAGVALQDKGSEAAPKSEQTTRIKTEDDKRKLDIQIKGDVKLNGEAAEPVVVTGNGSFTVKEKKEGKARVFTLTKGRTSYIINGEEQPFGKEGQEWVRSIVTETRKARAQREQVREMKVHAELDAREGQRMREVEIHMSHMDAQGRALDARGHALDDRLKELERLGQNAKPEEMTRLKAEAERLKSEGAQLKLEAERMKQNGERLKIDPKLKAERVNDFETVGGLSYRSDPPAAESRRGHGQPADCLAATGRWPALRVLSLTTAPWKTLRVSHTSPQKAISSIMRQFPLSVG